MKSNHAKQPADMPEQTQEKAGVSKASEKVAKHGMDTPMQRPGQPEEVAPVFVFFASNADSSYISGEALTILVGETRAL